MGGFDRFAVFIALWLRWAPAMCRAARHRAHREDRFPACRARVASTRPARRCRFRSLPVTKVPLLDCGCAARPCVPPSAARSRSCAKLPELFGAPPPPWLRSPPLRPASTALARSWAKLPELFWPPTRPARAAFSRSNAKLPRLVMVRASDIALPSCSRLCPKTKTPRAGCLTACQPPPGLPRCCVARMQRMAAYVWRSGTSHRGEFHAAIREVEPGVFRAEYRGELNPDGPGRAGTSRLSSGYQHCRCEDLGGANGTIDGL